ncbi:multisubunit sodium/proton antiporter MrpE subunit [Tepidamorphus gemmatus]|uniref:Multisubunit sodium/proton antiporter MrpE subunit n=1 Tax=Tepidamorphus gemmatus TaxID=747076 RepID=A0A4R3LZD6_9HYPH|nr:multisubunit sodium/proton antiporter MrpE subunit [Tepidamorphus gemmatus]
MDRPVTRGLRPKAMRLLGLAIPLLLFWLLLSGHHDTLLISIGIVCVLLTVWFSARLAIVDGESLPLHLLFRGLRYWPWLLVQIFKSAIGVTRLILSRPLAISPTLVRVTAHQSGPVGITTFANSITLTPGTISAVVLEQRHEILVHALTEEGAKDLAGGEMDRRVAVFEGGS